MYDVYDVCVYVSVCIYVYMSVCIWLYVCALKLNDIHNGTKSHPLLLGRYVKDEQRKPKLHI